MRLFPVLALALLTTAPACSAASPRAQRTFVPASELEDVPPAALEELSIEQLQGRWYVQRSNFPYWTRKDRHDVRFNYLHRADSAELTMFDDIAEYKQGKSTRERAWVGVDIQDPELPGHFMWRGNGKLYGVINHWYTVGLDVEAGWMVVYFPKSNFGSSAGLEIVTRQPEPDAAVIDAALRHIQGDADLRERGRGLKVVPRALAK